MPNLDLSHVTFFTFLTVYFAGVLTSFTPCIYPLIPVTVGYVGARSAGSRSKSFALSLAYVMGLSLVYSGLGVFAAMTGSLFGSWSSNPVTLIVIANVYIVLSLMMLDILRVPISISTEKKILHDVAGKGKKHLMTSFLVGASSALVAGPCTAPVLGALLVWIGDGKNLALGAGLMFLFSLGLGTLLLLAGTFAGFIALLPKSGHWLKGIKIFFALILSIAAEYFLIQAGKLLF